MISKRILFQFFRDQAESEQECEGGGVTRGRTEGGGEGVGHISVKIKLTAFACI